MTQPPAGRARISASAALGNNRVIGRPEGGLPWHLPEDLHRFNTLSMGHPVITGRVTFAESGTPLPGRLNIVVTRDTSFSADGVVVAHAVDAAIAYALAHDDEEIFIGGGAAIYRTALDRCDRLYLTLIHADFRGEARFPDYSRFQKVIEKSAHDNGTYQYDFVTLEM